MDEFRFRVFAPDWLEVEHPATGFAWAFSIDPQPDSRRILSGPTTTTSGGSQPNGNLTQAADNFARTQAVKAGRADG